MVRGVCENIIASPTSIISPGKMFSWGDLHNVCLFNYYVKLCLTCMVVVERNMLRLLMAPFQEGYNFKFQMQVSKHNKWMAIGKV